MGNVISGGKNPAIPSLLQNKEADKVKANTGLTKIIINLNKIKKKIKTLREAISSLTRNLQTPSKIIINLPRSTYTLAKKKEKEKRKRRKKKKRKGKRKKKKKKGKSIKNIKGGKKG